MACEFENSGSHPPRECRANRQRQLAQRMRVLLFLRRTGSARTEKLARFEHWQKVLAEEVLACAAPLNLGAACRVAEARAVV